MSAPGDFTFRAVEAARDRIAADGAFKSVESTLEAARNRPPRTPAAIVYPAADEPAPSVGGRAGTVQRITGRIAVLHVIGAPNDPLGARARRETGETVARTRGLLLGWTPEGADAPFALVAGRLEEIADGRVFWADTYAVEWVLDAQPSRRDS